MIEQRIGVRGIVRIIKREYDPALVEIPGTIVEDRVIYNKETNYLLNSLAKWLTGTSTTGLIPPTQIGAGSGSPPSGVNGAQPTDTALWSPIAGTQKACDSIAVSMSYYAQYNITYQTTDYSGLYTEFGLFDTSNNLWAHVQTNDYKSNTQTLTVQWMIELQEDTSNSQAIVTNYMKNAIAKWLTGVSNVSGQTGAVVPPTELELGTGAGALQTSDTGLWTPSAGTLKSQSFLTIAQNSNVQFAVTYQAAEANGTWTEAGWMDTANNLWMHAILSNCTKASPNIMSLVGQLNIQGD